MSRQRSGFATEPSSPAVGGSGGGAPPLPPGWRSRLDLKAPAVTLAALAALGLVPWLVRRDDLLNLGVVFLLAVALAQSWNVIGGLAGQVNLGHAAFFGLGALVARTLWVAGWPIGFALLAAMAVATAAGLLLGSVAFRLRGAYFAIGTLALAEGLRLSVGNVLPEISTLPAAAIAGYRLTTRYYAALALALASVLVVTALAASRLGLGMEAVREDEAAAAAAGVGALGVKLRAVAVSTALAGLCGGLFAYYHVSYYPQHAFSPHWTFDAVLITFIGGVGTIHGPVLGAAFYVLLKEYLAVRWVDAHLLIFGVLFVLIVLLLPGGLVEAGQRLRRARRRTRPDPGG
jgi:branched-chain amino acid transport system permease protein